MAVPFKKLNDAVSAENKLKEELSMAELFLKKVYPDRSTYKLMQDVRKMAEEHSVGDAVTSVVPDLPFDLYITNRACNAHCLLSGDFRKNDVIRWAIGKIGKSNDAQEEAAVLFKLNNLGVFVLHNVSMTMQANPRVVIPASTTGISQLQIIHLDYFADDFLGRRIGK